MTTREHSHGPTAAFEKNIVVFEERKAVHVNGELVELLEDTATGCQVQLTPVLGGCLGAEV